MKDIVIVANFCRDFSETDNGRFMYLCKELSKSHKIEIITNDFSHDTKKPKTPLTHKWPFTITYLHEPGYKKNISVQRFISHRVWGKEVAKYLRQRKKPDIVYCAVPSLTAPYEVAKYCKEYSIKYIIDIQDLWPEAFQMVFNVPIISKLIFWPFEQLANKIYSSADEICGVSQCYVNRALSENSKCKYGHAVFLGTSLETFDKNAKEGTPSIKKDNPDEIWLGYCGQLSASYDIPCVIKALKILKNKGCIVPKFVVMGDGSRRSEFEKIAEESDVDVNFLGSLHYDDMCAQLVQCDLVVNPIVKGSAASIINKHGDYASSGLPVLNTQDSPEYRGLIDEYHMGINCNNEDAEDLANSLRILVENKNLRKEMGINARRCAEEKFDRRNSYKELVITIVG